ncbi:hypothetical protein Tsubulata_029201 [Turnera subulata]|uniref:Dof zinc finger protein n=1 Tax=Turnera subulata TaxID=218843 RepID=A0A9Q0JMD8_9ROSI|nr:hypothetical protein Tsubulata_029201 [Turnera subulata]
MEDIRGAGWIKGNVEMCPSCPRCGSSNTKFCYYNNYSLTQPRYFCKGCRRYWTKGGSLRNVPVGGGCRKSRRSSSAKSSLIRLHSSSSSSSLHYNHLVHTKTLPHHNNNIESIHKAIYDSADSSLPPHSNSSHIDLAVVYANFLNPVHHDQGPAKLPELPVELNYSSSPDDQLTGFSNNNLHTADPGHHVPLPEENAFVNISACFSVQDAPSTRNDHMMYYSETEQLQSSFNPQETSCTGHDTSNYGLPPLPGEAQLQGIASDQEILCSSFTLPILGPDPNNPLFSDWSTAFDLSGNHTFSSKFS